MNYNPLRTVEFWLAVVPLATFTRPLGLAFQLPLLAVQLAGLAVLIIRIKRYV